MKVSIPNVVFVAVAASAVVATSCVKDVVLDAMDEPQVVVDCILTDEPVQTLRLLYTKGASRAEAPDLPEAEAVLTDLTEGKQAGRFVRTADRSWRLDYATVPGHRYRLDVSVPGHEPIWAEQTMPEAPGVEARWHPWNPEPERNDNTVGYSFRFVSARNPVWFYGVNHPTLESPGEKAEYLCTDALFVDPFNETEGWRFAEESSGNYLWGDRGKSAFRTTTYPNLQDAPLHKRFLRFPSMEAAPDTTFYVSGSLQGYIGDIRDFLHAEMRPAELHWFSASEDYDRFLQDSYQLMDLKTSTDLADIFVRDNAYTNIHGAIGLFGARVERMLEWDGKETWQASGYFLLAGFITNHIEGITYRLKRFLKSSRPFDLLHFEYWKLPSVDGQVPAWMPENPEAHNAAVRFYLKVVESQAQLDSVGLGGCGEVDFSRKKVLVCAVGGAVGLVPVLIGYGHPGTNTGEASVTWPDGEYAPLVGYVRWYNDNDYLYTPFRIALAVDKEEPIASNVQMWVQFSNRLLTGSFADELSDGIAWTY